MNAPPRYVVGAYAASPAHQRWDPVLEERFLRGLAELPGVGAFELPWMGSLHPHDDDWLLDRMPEAIDAVVTDIPFIMPRLAADPGFGLASRDLDGRRAAIAAAGLLRDDVARLNDRRQRRAVVAVELHSAPRRDRADAGAFAASLGEIASWEWHGATLLVEHCDTLVAGRDPEKGFLRLAEEIGAIRLSGADIGLWLNWGRSAIELRDAGLVAEQIAEAAASGLLRGLMLSGAADRDGVFGHAWIDAHHPFRRDARHPFGDPDSLLTEDRAAVAIAAAGDLPWLGVKVGWPGDEGAVEDRVRMVAHAVDALARAEASDVRSATFSIS